MLHQMTPNVVRNQGERYAVLLQFPGRQARPLVAGTRLVNPHVHLAYICVNMYVSQTRIHAHGGVSSTHTCTWRTFVLTFTYHRLAYTHVAASPRTRPLP